MNVSGVAHVSIGAKDVVASIEFYESLGATVDPSRPDFGFPGAWMQLGGQQVHLIQSDIVPPGQTNHFALIVDDMEAWATHLEDRGFTVRRLAYNAGAGYQAFVLDPSGNVVELNQPE